VVHVHARVVLERRDRLVYAAEVVGGVDPLNISPELAEYLLALEVRIRKLEGI
jgi:hypothetical protein